MTEMPEDIMDVALAIHEELQRIGYLRDDRSDDAPPVYMIANAILAERQRCADVARSIGRSSMRSTRYTDTPQETARLIANDILNP